MHVIINVSMTLESETEKKRSNSKIETWRRMYNNVKNKAWILISSR